MNTLLELVKHLDRLIENEELVCGQDLVDIVVELVKGIEEIKWEGEKYANNL